MRQSSVVNEIIETFLSTHYMAGTIGHWGHGKEQSRSPAVKVSAGKTDVQTADYSLMTKCGDC